ncbi:MAG: hypothetical protein R2879_17985 [Saprospiraceae bacterium]
MVVLYNGHTDRRSSICYFGEDSFGLEQIYDIGANLYFNPDLKLSLHYTHRRGDPGDAGDGSTVNNYFFQGRLSCHSTRRLGRAEAHSHFIKI